jgi:nucleoside-diphosphate-sugar epimerase
MTKPAATVIVTGISGNLGRRLLPLLGEFRVVGVDLQPPDFPLPLEFHAMNLGHEPSCRELTQLIRDTSARSVVHLGFVMDHLRVAPLDVERTWQINVAGTARVMEAISVVNRTGGHVSQFIFTGSVAAYGPENAGAVMEDSPLRGHTLPYAIQKRESDEVVRYRAESLGECRVYVLRPHIYAGSSVENYLMSALRESVQSKSHGAARMRAKGRRLAVVLPRGRKYVEQRFQFVHIDDVARLIAYVMQRPHSDPPLTILNVAAHGEPLSMEACIEIAQTNVTRVPSRAACRMVAGMMWKWGMSSIPPEALPYMIGSYTMDTTRLQQFLGPDYPEVIRYSVEEALRDSFAGQ